MSNKILKKRGAWVLGGVVIFLGLPAAATVIAGGGLRTGGLYNIAAPQSLTSAPCFPTAEAINTIVAPDGLSNMVEIRVNTRKALEDGDPDTYLRCTMLGDDNGRSSMMCYVGHPNGNVSVCQDPEAPNHLPALDDRVYMNIDMLAPTDPNNCDIFIEKAFGEAIPSCRTATTSSVNDCFLPAYAPGTSYTPGASKVTNVCTSGEIGQVSGCVPGKKEVFLCMDGVDPYYCNSLSPGVSSGWWSAWKVLSQCN